jgi:hypothetical protein
MSALVMANEVVGSATDPVAEEAGTDEVAALATMWARAPHIPGPRQDDEDDDFEVMPRHEANDPVVAALPRQRNEFTCARCFLVVHLSCRVGEVCRDCS